MYLDNHITKDEDYTVLNALDIALIKSNGLIQNAILMNLKWLHEVWTYENFIMLEFW